MTHSRRSGNSVQFALLLSVILTIAVVLTGCDTSGDNGADSSGTSETGGLVYLGETTPLTQLVLYRYGEISGVYNIELGMYSSGIDRVAETGSGMIVFLDAYFSSSEVTGGTYSWTDASTPGADTFSGDGSDIYTVVNGVPASTDPITAGSVTISISGSTYTISGIITTSKGSANFTYDGTVTEDILEQLRVCCCSSRVVRVGAAEQRCFGSSGWKHTEQAAVRLRFRAE